MVFCSSDYHQKVVVVLLMGQNEGKHAAKKNNTPGHSRKVSKASGEGSDSDSVDTTSSSQSPISPSGSKNIMASFFRKQSDACRKRMDHQLYLVSYPAK